MKTARARSKPPLLTSNKHDVSTIARVEIERNVPPGNLRANGPANTLCSYCVVASTTYATSPPMDSIICRHSTVGATGSWTQSRPSLILTIVHRTLVLTPRSNPMPCSCSSVHTFPLTTSRSTVRLERNGTRGKGKERLRKIINDNKTNRNNSTNRNQSYNQRCLQQFNQRKATRRCLRRQLLQR